MSIRAICSLLLAVVIGICGGCANITAPTGGKKDKIPPKLVSITPADSLKNTRVNRIEMYFDEYITVSDVSKEVQISPLIKVDPTVTGMNKHVIVKIVDSLLDSNTTYRISFGKAIKDLHEGNPFPKYTYTFSTGSYFDSLELRGTVINAATGLPDTGNVLVVLYSASEPDIAVVKHKPKYVTHADGSGAFVFKGLPNRHFHIFSLKDANGNLTYDGPAGGEMIAFNEKTVRPGDTLAAPIKLRLFAEIPDTAARKAMDSAARKPLNTVKPKKGSDALVYDVQGIDTSNVIKRTFDLNKSIKIVFSKLPAINKDKIRLVYDSSGISVSPEFSVTTDSFKVFINTNWFENKVYTLRLTKGFAKDTSGADVMPARFTFRTMEEEDYGKVSVIFPLKYVDSHYLLQVTSGKDTIYRKPITDSVEILSRLKPAKYTFCIIVDKNGNGKWDTGELIGRIQPEEVIPGGKPLNVKAGFEYDQDFERKTINNGSKDAPGK